jgi:anti-sigma regulatory factor (Ser/Thr protein kinase)
MSQLVVPAALESLAAVSEFVKEVAATAALDRRAAYGLRLAVIELVTNTITHGYIEANLSGTINLQANLDDQALTLVLEDTAIPYDPSQTATPDDLDRPAEEREVGGLGVYLALEQVDAYRYERVGDRNRSVLVMNRPGGGKRGP